MLCKMLITLAMMACCSLSVCAQTSNLVSAVSNFGSYGDPNATMPSNKWPYGSSNSYNYLWEGRYWVGAVVNGVRHVTHADYSAGYEWHSLAGASHDSCSAIGITAFADSVTYTDQFPQADHFPLLLQVSQIVTAFPVGQGPDEAFLVRQTLRNIGNYNLDSVYIAWVFDYDVASGDLWNPNIDDWASYQPQRSLGYMWDGDNPAEPGDDTGDYGRSLGYAGIALLDAPMPLCSFQWWNWNEDPGNDNEMFQFMAGIHPASQGHPFRPDPDSVFDYRVLISTGPYTLNPGDSIYTAMTFAVGDSMDGLEQAVDEMAVWYNQNVQVVKNPGIVTPAQYSLGPPRPNPFNSSTLLSFELRAANFVTLTVWDTQGRLVETLVDGWTQAGTHSANFDGSSLASGIYLYHLTAGTYTASGKMVLMK